MFGYGFRIGRPPTPSLAARLMARATAHYPLTTSIPSGATFTRATTATVIDHDGIVRNCLSGEARFHGARRVENLFLNTEFSGGVAGSPGTAPSGWYIDSAVAGLSRSLAFGSDTNGAYIDVRYWGTNSSGSNFYPALSRSGPYYRPTKPGRRYSIRFTVALIAGAWPAHTNNPNIGWNESNGAYSYLTSTITSIKSTVPNSTPVKCGFQGTATHALVEYISPYMGFNIANAETVDFTVRVYKPQFEEITGASVLAPSEYVSSGALSAPYHGAGVDGVKYFQTLNGNSLAGNVLTEATGAPIAKDTLRGFLREEAGTQYLGVTDAPATQTTMSLGAGTYCLWMEGTGSATSSAGTATGSGWGAATDGSPNVITITGAGTVTVTVAGSPTRFQLEKNAFPTSYIYNGAAAGTSVTRNADSLTFPMAGIVNDAVGACYAEIMRPGETTFSSSVIYVAIEDASGRALYTANGDASTAARIYDGSTIVGAIGADIRTGIKKCMSSWGPAGRRIVSNGLAVTAGSFDGNMGAGGSANVHIGLSGFEAGFTIKNLAFWVIEPTDAEMQAATS